MLYLRGAFCLPSLAYFNVFPRSHEAESSSEQKKIRDGNYNAEIYLQCRLIYFSQFVIV